MTHTYILSSKYNVQVLRVSDPTGSHALCLGSMQLFNLIMPYRRLGQLPLNHFLAYHHHGCLQLIWPTSQQGMCSLICMHFYPGKATGLQSTYQTHSLTHIQPLLLLSCLSKF